MKKCTKCQENKEITMFYKRTASADGLMPLCKICHSLKAKARHAENPEKGILRSKRNKQKNLERYREVSREYSKRRRQENPEYFKNYYQENKEKWKYVSTPEKREYQRIRSAKDRPKRKDYIKDYYKNNKLSLNEKKRAYKKQNSGLISAINSKRRAKKINATIGNYKESFRIIYETIQGLTEFYNVDHIIPLNHTEVCGLHVPWNLQILTKEDNLRKGNKFDGTYQNESW